MPEEMLRESFDWLMTVSTEIIAIPGCESNIMGIFDTCGELKATRDDIVIINQFDEYGNHLWHYYVTIHAMEEVLEREMNPLDHFVIGTLF